ncbi:MAG: ATP-grasp domain-containing protein [bacterium]|nr:ATP-grasp domain-containing protein [bacterium]
MSFSEKVRVAILRGGPSSEYEVSLKTGATVLANLPQEYHPLDVFIDVEGNWHLSGRREEPHKILNKVDVVWNALHGEYGEDGGVQHLLEAHGTPFSGPRRLGAAISLNKSLAKKIVQKAGVKTPHYRLFRGEEISSLEAVATELYRTFPQPSIIKPAAKGSSIGVSLARTQQELLDALTAAFSISDSVLVEEFIQGKEAFCGVIDDFRGAKHYALLPVEIGLPDGAAFFDYQARHREEVMHRCPGNFTPTEKEELQSTAIQVHNVLDLRHYSGSGFIVHPKRGIFFTEVDSLPDLHPQRSPFLQSLCSVGIAIPSFLEHVLTLART